MSKKPWFFLSDFSYSIQKPLFCHSPYKILTLSYCRLTCNQCEIKYSYCYAETATAKPQLQNYCRITIIYNLAFIITAVLFEKFVGKI